MTPLCSNCHGDCCVNKRGSVVDHGSALALHSCPDCLDGFAPRVTAEQKRAAVDAYLRAPDEPNGFKPCPLCGSTIPDEPNELDDLREEVGRLREVCAPDLAAERLDALLDAERENTALRAEVMYLRAERAGTDEWLRTMVPNDKATAAERAAVVAWLRASVSPGSADDLYDGVRWRADEIENGEHRRGEGA